MLSWLIHLFLRPEFFGLLALLCGAGYVFFKLQPVVTNPIAPILAMACEVGGIVFLVLAAYAWADNRGYARAEAELRPKIEAAETRADTAEAANVELQRNLATMQAVLAEQAKAVDRLKRETQAAQNATRAALAKAAATAARHEAEIARLTALAAQPRATPLPPDQDAAAADTILRDVMRGLVAEQLP